MAVTGALPQHAPCGRNGLVPPLSTLWTLERSSGHAEHSSALQGPKDHLRGFEVEAQGVTWNYARARGAAGLSHGRGPHCSHRPRGPSER